MKKFAKVMALVLVLGLWAGVFWREGCLANVGASSGQQGWRL